jgi:hypothetical protein
MAAKINAKPTSSISILGENAKPGMFVCSTQLIDFFKFKILRAHSKVGCSNC